MTTPVADRLSTSTRKTAARRGAALIYATISMPVLIGFASLAVDAGRIQLARGELRRAADSAARAGAFGFETTAAQAKVDAITWSKKNAVDGRMLTDDCVAVTVGRWDTATRTFKTTLTGTQSYNAVRVVLSRPASGPNSVPIILANMIGSKGVEVRAEAIAMYVPGENVNHQVDGVANPFLSGMPKGTVASMYNPHNSPDYAGDATSSDLSKRKQSPPVVPLSVQPGQWIEFDNIAGTVRHDPSLTDYSPDGQLDDIGRNTRGNENGIGDVSAPINALVGVFMGADAPNTTAAPAVDATVTKAAETESGRDFIEMKPASKQIFFVGDGINSSGTRQRFQVPAGATRLFLATWDFYEWNNNSGYRIVRVSRPGSVVTVK